MALAKLVLRLVLLDSQSATHAKHTESLAGLGVLSLRFGSECDLVLKLALHGHLIFLVSVAHLDSAALLALLGFGLR